MRPVRSLDVSEKMQKLHRLRCRMVSAGEFLDNFPLPGDELTPAPDMPAHHGKWRLHLNSTARRKIGSFGALGGR
jgi:hypothetical protein